ncbi:MAG TPA: DUF4340 domain-containing protein [Gemmataceae bacterium]|jgi:hypothetical protein
MNVKTTLALVLLTAGGVLLWWFGGPQLPFTLDPASRPTSVADQGTRDFLNGLKPQKITRLEVQAPRGLTTLSRKKADGAWSMPGNWPIREAEVQALVDLLAGLRSRFEPEPLAGEKKLAELGLERPAVTVKLTADGEEHTLSFGEQHGEADENRFSRDTYLRLDKKPEAVRLAPGLIAALDRPADYYQQRRLFQGERVTKEGGREKVERLVARSVTVEDKKPNGAHFTLAHHGSDWELAEPVRDRLDASGRDALLAAVPDLWAEQFIPAGTGGVTPSLWRAHTFWNAASLTTDLFFATQGGLLVRSGLIDPERTITVKYTNGDTLTLFVGSVSGRRVRMVAAPPQPGMPPGMPQRTMPVTEEFRYAKLQYNDQIFEIKGDKLKDVFVSLDTLRDAHVARFSTADARRVEIKQGGEDIVLEKDKDNWKLIKPLAAEADNSKVTDLLNKLADLQARDKDVLDKEDPKKYGLDKPDAEVIITVEEEAKGGDKKDGEKKEKKKRTMTVRVGKHDTDKKKLYVMADDWPRINAVDDSLEPLVTRSAVAYRGKRLFDFPSSDVVKIAIENKDQKFTLEHDKDTWRLASPVKAEADSLKVDQLAASLGKLEAVEYVNQTPKKDDLETLYGLGKPSLIVGVEFKDKKKPPQVLRVGKSRGGKGGYFAQLADAPETTSPVFAINTEIHNQLARDSLSYRPLTLWQLLPEEIVSLRVHKAGQKEYVLTRSDNDWKISGPFEANALGDTVRKMITELGSPKVESYTAHEAKDLASYGLDKPALTVNIKVVLEKYDKEHTLLIGKPAEAASTRYAKLANEEAIFTVGDTLVRAADRAALDLLDTKLLNLDPAKLERMRSGSGDTSLTLEKKGDAWRVTESPAGAYPADIEATASLSSLWSNLRAERFADYGGGVEWAKYGLDKPTVTVTASGDKASEHTVELGKDVEDEPGSRYARVDKGPGVAVLPPEPARLLGRTYLDYVNRSLLKFDSGATVSLQRHMGANVLEVVKKDDAWEVAKPKEEKADDKGMQDLLDQLADLRADRIAAYPAKDLKAFGLDAPAALVTIKLKDGQKPAEHIIKLGKTTGERGERFALVDDGKAVAVLPGALAERLAGSPLTFRDRAIARFSDADRLQLERGPRKAIFSKVDGSWKLTEPMQGEAEQDPLDDFLNSLARLRADALVAEKPAAADLKKYGLDHPEAHWRLQSGDKEVLNLLIGDKEKKGSRRYAKLAKGDIVFLLDPRLSQKVLDEYRPRTVWTPPLDAVQIESLNYRYARNLFRLEKIDSTWQAVGKPDAKVNTATAEDTLAALAGLKLSRYAVDKGANLALFGLDKPELVLEVATRSGKRVLHVGNTEGNSKRRYARIPDSERGDVFVLDEETCARVVRDLNAFGKPPARSAAEPAAR